MQLYQRVALITGGTLGIGAATAVALAREGASVALVARGDGAHVAAVRDQVEALDRRCETFALPLLRSESYRSG